MRWVFLATGLSLLTAAAVHAQPIIVPLSPQPERQPPPPPPLSAVPIARPQAPAVAGQAQEAPPPVIEFNGNLRQQTAPPASPAATVPPRTVVVR